MRRARTTASSTSEIWGHADQRRALATGRRRLIGPDQKYVRSIDLKPRAFSDAAADQETARHFEEILTDWCDKTEALLDASEDAYAMSAKEDAGRTPRLSTGAGEWPSSTMRAAQGRSAVWSRVSMTTRWAQAVESCGHEVTDASNESKDNVKYLTTLENSMTPLYEGDPRQILDGIQA